MRTWKPIPEDMIDGCLLCGGQAEVLSGDWNYEGEYEEDDEVRCVKCGCPGRIVVDEGGEEAVALIEWHEPNED